MKYLLPVIAFFSLSTLTVVAQPKIEFNKKTHDFGEILWKKPATATFQITNKGDKPLVISKVTSSCGCTAVDWTKSPILPGGTGTITSIYDAKILGHFNKSIGIYSNAANKPVYLSINGKVSTEIHDYSKLFPYQIGSIRLDREEITFDDVNMGEKPMVELNLVNLYEKPYSPVLMHLPPYMSAVAIPEKLPTHGIGKMQITIDTKKIKNFGLTTAPIYLARFPGDKVGDENEIPVSVVILPDFSKLSEADKVNPPLINLSSMEVDLGELTVKQRKTYTIIVKNNGHSNLEIRDLQVFNPALGVQLDRRTIRPKAVGRLKVVVYGRNLKKAKNTLRLLMITNDPKNPKIIIRVKANLKK